MSALQPFCHRVKLSDGSSVILEVKPDPYWSYMGHGDYKVNCYVLDSMLVSCAFSPSRGFHEGGIANEDVGEALERAVKRLYKAGKLPPSRGA